MARIGSCQQLWETMCTVSCKGKQPKHKVQIMLPATIQFSWLSLCCFQFIGHAKMRNEVETSIDDSGMGSILGGFGKLILLCAT